jgi:single-strand DNA-binding protein
MNNVCLMGRLTKDIELKQTEKTAVARFNIAVNRQFKKEGEERQADFISCVAFGHTANHIAKYFNKGSMISVVGRIQTGSYDKDGQKVYTTDVVVDSCYFCGEKNNNKSDTYESQTNNTGFSAIDDSSDLPF